MNRIHVLDSYIANRIAAGEVVERPASVVKELLENAIDADATAVTIETRGGGLESIRVSDNGSGIATEDAATAFLPHATSKINSSEDLFSISTLGFRGEALPSIAAVSRVTMRTRLKGAHTGALIRIEGGDIIENHEAGVPEGTTVECSDLFYNVPARLKFIKSARAESAHISDYVSRMIMARPDVMIKLIQSGKTVFHSEGNGELDSAIACVYGNDILDNLREIYYDDGYFSLVGFIGTEQIGRSSRTAQSFFVNCRYIRSQRLSYALQRAYDTRLMQGRFPFAALHISLSPEEVDVNVHPNKLEVRFRHEDKIMGAFVSQCSKALERPIFVPAEYAKEIKASNEIKSPSIMDKPVNLFVGQRAESRIDLAAMHIEAFNVMPSKAALAANDAESVQKGNAAISNDAGVKAFYNNRAGANESSYGKQESDSNAAKETAAFMQPESVQTKTAMINPVQQMVDFSQYEIIGQLFSCYWVIQHEDEVIFIDQHAAHERRLYERIIEQKLSPDSQQLLIPEVIKLAPMEFSILTENIESFREIGFDIEEFGPLTVGVRAVPGIMDKSDIKSFLLDAIAQLDAKNKLTTMDMKRSALITRACKSAIKAGERIDESEIRALLDQYNKEGVPLTCPHGRPVMARMTKAEFEKLFRRTV